ncbi:hypothetical protein LDENG_00002820 [Lucifuga dentata]|nr:hypothetical protein LDENG_00002820 [Lucifuga dentata]
MMGVVSPSSSISFSYCVHSHSYAPIYFCILLLDAFLISLIPFKIIASGLFHLASQKEVSTCMFAYENLTFSNSCSLFLFFFCSSSSSTSIHNPDLIQMRCPNVRNFLNLTSRSLCVFRIL